MREVTETGYAKEKVPTRLTTEDISPLKELFFFYQESNEHESEMWVFVVAFDGLAEIISGASSTLSYSTSLSSLSSCPRRASYL